MVVYKNQNGNERKNKPCNLWTKEEEKKLLEFILMNPNDVIDGPKQRRKMIPNLYKYVQSNTQSNKTEEDCKNKMKTLLKFWKTYGELLNALKKSANVDDNWILEKKEAAESMGIDF